MCDSYKVYVKVDLTAIAFSPKFYTAGSDYGGCFSTYKSQRKLALNYVLVSN